MTNFKKITTFLMALIIFLTLGSNTVFASVPEDNTAVFDDGSYVNLSDDDSNIALYYANIDGISASITSKGAKAYLSTSVDAKSKNNIKIMMCLERLDGSMYKTIAYWTDSAYDDLLSVDSSRVINLAEKYRLRSVVTVGSGSVTVYRYL